LALMLLLKAQQARAPSQTHLHLLIGTLLTAI